MFHDVHDVKVLHRDFHLSLLFLASEVHPQKKKTCTGTFSAFLLARLLDHLRLLTLSLCVSPRSKKHWWSWMKSTKRILHARDPLDQGRECAM